jgi:hypothetical protein
MDDLTTLERQVMDMLLFGEFEALAVLRQQLATSRIVDREMTGVGFFARFSVLDDSPLLQDRRQIVLDDVCAEIVGVKHGAGFLLFINDGKLNILEGFTYDEPWPNEVGRFALKYVNDGERDLDKVAREFGHPANRQ